MTRDPFFDDLDADVDSGADDVPSATAASSLNADVDDWFERAAAGRAAASPSGIDSRPTELLGAAALPLDGDLVRPARERCLKPPRAETPRPHRAVTATTAAVRRRRRRGLVLLAFGGLVVVIAVVVLIRPVPPVAPAGPVLARGLTGPSSPVADIGDAVRRSLAADRERIARARAYKRAVDVRARRRAARRAAARERRAGRRGRSARAAGARRRAGTATVRRAGIPRRATPAPPPAASLRSRYPTSEFDF